MGWATQAVKAGFMADITELDLEGCLKKAAAGFKKNYGAQSGYGKFGYTGPSKGASRWGGGLTGLTGLGVLCLQFCNEPNCDEAQGGLNTLVEEGKCAWDISSWRSIYYWYYDTQARFQAGGEVWNSWNAQFAMELVKNQTRVAGQYQWNGEDKEIGYWTTAEDKHGYILNTTLCCLMLQVYYRYLPTYKAPDAIAPAAAKQQAQEEEKVQVNINI
jgi:hypothetical protein